ncbi:hypothetical protein BV25DRAFT_1807734 [Artomyces pyxidatus]|uniref:Uncharacterized protein n=1 Tax=Artomyces pyxidatus TaxID=48021 RepID=A0ACB8SUU0_9AGAM|nr:hypothetical protein BV25DRAFT_1807734 [Artomyces pyxidatus]
MMTNNSNGDDSAVRNQYKQALDSLELQMGNFSAWLNGTDTGNWTMPSRPPAENDLISAFISPSAVLDPFHHSYFPNITGFIRGPSTVYNISAAALNGTSHAAFKWEADAGAFMEGVNVTESAEKLGTWNWTAVEKVTLSVMEKAVEDEKDKEWEGMDDVVMVHGHVELIDGNTAEELRFDFEGVHFLKNGSVFGFAEPSGSIIDIRELPSLVPPSVLNLTARAIVPTLRARIAQLTSILSAGDFSSDSDSSLTVVPEDTPSRPACTFAVYAQLLPTNVSSADMTVLEEELMRPTGVSTVKRPSLVMDGVMTSRECGILIKLEEAEGLRSRLFFRKVTTYAGFSGFLYLTLLLLLSHQMSESSTPAALARISRWTFLAQALADSISFAGHVTFAILADGRPSMALVVPAFLSCALFSYEVKFALLIQQVQAPEDAIPTPAPTPAPAPVPAAPPEASPAPTPASAEPEVSSPNDGSREPLLPTTNPASALVPAPAPTPTQPATPQPPSIFRIVIDHFRSDPQARIWLIFFIVLTIVVRIVLAPHLALLFFVFLYSALWAPQIVRAARRGRTCSLGLRYVIGTTLGRGALALYFLGCPTNVLDIEPRSWIYLLVLFMFVQIGLLQLQDSFGPAFFLPARYSRRHAYDYHPPLPAPSDPEAHGSLGDCAICMDAIVYDGDEDEEKHVTGVLGIHVPVKGNGRRNYSLSPCAHLFHTECLERWLAIKNICPQCRRPLPPL